MIGSRSFKISCDKSFQDSLSFATTSPCALVVDIKALKTNYVQLQTLSSKAGVASVVKADAYGLGANYVSSALYEKGCRTFFVATIEEGIALRETLDRNAEIYIFQGYEQGLEPIFERHALKPVLISFHQLKGFFSYIKTKETSLKAALHFDTGMSRTGIPEKEVTDVLDLIRTFPKQLRYIDLIFSHLACSDQRSALYNWQQVHRFSYLKSFFPFARGSFANSGGAFIHDAFHFDMLRTGAALYGVATQKTDAVYLEPVLSIYAKVCQIQDVLAHQTVGYSQTYKAIKTTRVATLSIGYADGLPFGAKDVFVTFKGFKAPVIGRISMDLLSVDVTQIPKNLCEVGLFAQVIGKESLSIDEWAQKSNTISYDILVKLGKRFERVYQE
ncbi:MAG TPA: alanine racemase [Alphaproteobacteria bacterium]|nr:alanine racemase [Alphaproteobacteria bacterium]